jgi:hypothetical protein
MGRSCPYIISVLCLISGFCCGVENVFTLLGYYAAYVDNSLPMIRNYLSLPSSRVKTFEKSFDFLTLKMGLLSCPETLVRNYNNTLHNIQKECRSHICTL